jgi:hypothetical protein
MSIRFSSLNEQPKDRTESPLKHVPLRTPGQSLTKEIFNLLLIKLLPPYLFAVSFFAMSLGEWSKWFFSSPPAPWLYTSLFALSFIFAAWNTKRIDRKLKQLQQGLDGEKAVAEYLDLLREEGFRVIHDIPADRFNIDHVLIGPQGVFMVETKTLSKRYGVQSLEYDGERIFVGSSLLSKNPIPQTKSQAYWLHEKLKNWTGKNLYVQPIVVFPGWDEIKQKDSSAQVWVLPPKHLEDRLKGKPVVLKDNEVIELSNAIKRYVRDWIKEDRASAD